MRLYVLAICIASLLACERLEDMSQTIDRLSFSLFGGTVFGQANRVTMKEIHLDKGLLLGQQVFIEGEIVEIGRFNTFVVLSDNTARMLVVLTDLEAFDFFADESKLFGESLKGKNIRILGIVDYGKKGLPYVLAKSIIAPQEAKG